ACGPRDRARALGLPGATRGAGTGCETGPAPRPVCHPERRDFSDAGRRRMMRGLARAADGTPILLLGLDAENLRSLIDYAAPILSTTADFAPLPLMRLVIVGGVDDASIHAGLAIAAAPAALGSITIATNARGLAVACAEQVGGAADGATTLALGIA